MEVPDVDCSRSGADVLPLDGVEIPSRYEEFDFAWPLGAYGRSSGWIDDVPVEATMANPSLAPRRPVSLLPVGKGVQVDILGSARFVADDVAVCIKQSKSKGIVGLSSGASSALVRQNEGVIKIKRCGYLARGVETEAIVTPVQVIRDGVVFEATDVTLVGLMTLQQAINEIETLNELRRIGLCSSYCPKGVVIVTRLDGINLDVPPIGVALVACSSDLRADELAYMALTPMLAECTLRGDLHLNLATGLFEVRSSHCFASIRTRYAACYERLYLLGIGLGGALRRLHDAGFLRGRGSSWFGNEVVARDGRISIVDADGGTVFVENLSSELRAALQGIELSDYRAGFVGYMSWGQPLSLAYCASVLDRAFLHGYERRAPAAITADAVRAIISEHLAVFRDVAPIFGFGQPC
ncbi:MAG: hypothetical protein ACK53H_11000 [Betaproteobacteria bacterium]|jgi:hypothetical protein